MRIKPAVIILSLAALFGASAPAFAQTASAGSTAGNASPRIFVVTSGGESNEDAIAGRAAVDSSYRRAATELAGDWASRLGRGVIIRGLKGTTVAQQLQSVRRLSGELAASGKPASPDGTSTVAGTNATAVSARVVVPLVDGTNPNSFDVRGEPGSGRSYWTGMTLIVAGRFCGPEGCGSDTDRYTSKVTINPGTKTSRVNGQNLYFPDSGNFGNKHFQLWAINRGTIVGDFDTGGLPASSQDFVSSIRPLNGNVLTVAVTLWVYLNPYGNYTADGAKTNNCHGAAAPDNACIF